MLLNRMRENWLMWLGIPILAVEALCFVVAFPLIRNINPTTYPLYNLWFNVVSVLVFIICPLGAIISLLCIPIRYLLGRGFGTAFGLMVCFGVGLVLLAVPYFTAFQTAYLWSTDTWSANGNVYWLTYRIPDAGASYYNLYQCNEYGFSCNELFETSYFAGYRNPGPYANPANAALIHDENTLVLRIVGEIVYTHEFETQETEA